MTFHSLGDLAGQLMLSSARLRADQDITRLTRELTTGITSDKGNALENDFSALASWERTAESARVREKTLSEAITRLQAKQQVLAAAGEQALTLSSEINLATTTGTELDQQAVSTRARNALDQTLAQFNTRAAEQSLFAGDQTGRAAMAEGATVFAALKAAVTGAITAQDVVLGVQNWMDDALGGFEATAYLGGDASGPPIRLGDGRTISDPVKGDHDAIRSTIQSLALAALASDSDLALSGGGPKEVLNVAASGLRNAQSELIMLEASLGQSESEATRARVQAASELSTVNILRADALAVDQYETATRLQDAQLQLEKIYTLTARSARLSLLEYM